MLIPSYPTPHGEDEVEYLRALAHEGLRRRYGDPPPAAAVERLEMELEVIIKRSEEHTSELQSRQYLVCRLLLEKKKNKNIQSLFNNNQILNSSLQTRRIHSLLLHFLYAFTSLFSSFIHL